MKFPVPDDVTPRPIFRGNLGLQFFVLRLPPENTPPQGDKWQRSCSIFGTFPTKTLRKNTDVFRLVPKGSITGYNFFRSTRFGSGSPNGPSAPEPGPITGAHFRGVSYRSPRPPVRPAPKRSRNRQRSESGSTPILNPIQRAKRILYFHAPRRSENGPEQPPPQPRPGGTLGHGPGLTPPPVPPPGCTQTGSARPPRHHWNP
jgi:hypothetical protein